MPKRLLKAPEIRGCSRPAADPLFTEGRVHGSPLILFSGSLKSLISERAP
jgi:hypothetical protein